MRLTLPAPAGKDTSDGKTTDKREGVMRKKTLYSVGLGVVLCLVMIVGCARHAALPDYGPLRSEVEQLYLNYHELKILHSKLHAAARQHIERGGDQLAEIQSAARFIDQANLIAYYQWELLSIIEYIRVDRRSDYFTLRVKDIDDARQKSRDLIMSVKVYDAFIRDQEALTLIAKGIGYIEQHIAAYDALQALMAPKANPPAAGSVGGWSETL